MDNTCVVCRKLEIRIIWVVCHSSQSDFRFFLMIYMYMNIHTRKGDRRMSSEHHMITPSPGGRRVVATPDSTRELHD